MSSVKFINDLESLCQRSDGNFSSNVPHSDVRVLAAKYLYRESKLLTEDGHHVFSLCSSIPKSAMRFVFDTVKYTNHPQLFYGVDSASYSPYHYAAMHDLDGVFDHLVKCGRGLDAGRIRSLCLHVNPATRHSVSSILIEKDKKDILQRCMCELLGVSPFESDFSDTYVSWLHDCIHSDARATCLYLCRCHDADMRRSVLRIGEPTEHMTPLDTLLLSDANANKIFYVDAILGGMPGGMKTRVVTYDVLLARMLDVAELSTRDASWFLRRCIHDNILARSGIEMR